MKAESEAAGIIYKPPIRHQIMISGLLTPLCKKKKKTKNKKSEREKEKEINLKSKDVVY